MTRNPRWLRSLVVGVLVGGTACGPERRGRLVVGEPL